MFTQRAVLLGFVSFCFYLIAVVNTLPGYYYALTWLSMAMLAASLGVAWLSLVGLECRLEMTRTRGAATLGERVGEGSGAGLGEGGSRSALVALSVSNGGTLNKTNVILEIRVASARDEVQVLRFLMEAVPSGAAIESVLPLLPLRRGRYQLKEARLIGSDVLGLFRMQKAVHFQAQDGREIIIGPPVLGSEGQFAASASGYLSGLQRATMARNGDELRGTRPYAPGDDLRHVHWKSSARAGELVVKEWEHTGQSSALVIWDGAAESAWGSGDFDSGEWGLILAASLCHALLAGGVPCDFARFDDAPMLIESRTLIGGELPTELTDVLSGAQANRTSPLEEAFQSLSRLSLRMGSKPILVSASLSTELVRAVSFLRARGALVQVVLIDAASLAERAGDARFSTRGARLPASKLPTQGQGDGAVAVSSANFALQMTRLREVGALTVAVSARDDESAHTTLTNALRSVSYAAQPGQLRA